MKAARDHANRSRGRVQTSVPRARLATTSTRPARVVDKVPATSTRRSDAMARRRVDRGRKVLSRNSAVSRAKATPNPATDLASIHRRTVRAAPAPAVAARTMIRDRVAATVANRANSRGVPKPARFS